MATAKKKAKSKPAKKAPPRKRPVPKKAPPRAKKPTVKRAPAKKAAAKKPAAKKPTVKKAVAKKPAPKPAASLVAKPATPQRPAPVAAQKPPVVTLSAVAVPPKVIAKRKTAPVPERGPLPGEDPIGVVTHYYNHIGVAVVRLDNDGLAVGDMVRILGHTTDFRQRIDSMEIEHEAVDEVGRRQAFGVKVSEPVREHDVVYKVA